MSAIPTKAREGVHRRTGRICDRCGMAGNQIHHRQRRREGGHGLANLVLLCDTCHTAVHAHPAESKAAGFIVTVGQDPAAVVLRGYAGPILLDDDGGETFVVERPTSGSHA